MLTAIERERPTLCFFLGDGECDLILAQERCPALPFYAVRGNCDPRSKLSGALACTVGGVRIFATHGHLYNVKYEPELDTLAAAAEGSGAELVLFGHSHRACMEKHRDLTFLNPGTIGRTARPGYAVLTVEDGRFSAELKTV